VRKSSPLPLAAAVNAALVRALASVDSAVTSQRAAVAEALLAVGLLAHVGTLTRVGALVHSQRRALDE